MSNQFDFIVVGAGSAGCVVAARLTEANFRVLLIEAGPRNTNPWTRVPFGMQMLIANPKLNWLYESTPTSGLAGRQVFQPRGKIIGGTGSINASLYVRGNPADFDGWAAAGCRGWSYSDVLPYFKKSEDQENGSDHFHSQGGPIRVSNGKGDALSRIFLEAVDSCGFARTNDFNGVQQEGFGPFQATIRRNRRSSSAEEYLKPALRQSNLSVVTNALATRILFDGKRAIGVSYRVGDQTLTAIARHEVVLCGGVFNSPQLLELSGIGHGGLHQRLGISTVHHLPGVGENLQEHFGIKIVHRVNDPALSLNRVGNMTWRKILAGARYVLRRSGPLAWPNTFVGGFVRSDPRLTAPDLQFTLNAWSSTGFGKSGMTAHSFPGFTVNAYHLQPNGRGAVHITSCTPWQAPEIRFSALETEYDRSALREAVRILRKITTARQMREIGTTEILPGPRVAEDNSLDGFIRDHAIGLLHPVGTCRMGSDERAVVDPCLRVRGVSRLRVMDASIMPTLPRGNTNAATLMIAEKGSSMLLADVFGR